MNQDDDRARKHSDVVALDVGGHRPLYYLTRDTLQRSYLAGSYLAARFRPDSLLPARPMYRDPGTGADVYFVERDGSLFCYIHAFIAMGGATLLPPSLPSFRDDPHLWRALRAEADFFGLDRLAELLQTTFTCHPDTHGDRGVLYWMGTNKGQRDDYRNPLTDRMVDIICWIDTVAAPSDADAMELKVCKAKDQFVHNRVPCDDIFADDRWSSSSSSSTTTAAVGYALSVSYACLSGLGGHFKYNTVHPVVIDLKSIRLRPTYFSMRASGTGSNSVQEPIRWHLEGSVDGKRWTCLHSSAAADTSSSSYLRDISLDVKRSFLRTFREQRRADYVQLATEYVESHHRHVWSIVPVPDTYFRYLRFVGSGGQQDEFPQGTGLELYGDVNEE